MSNTKMTVELSRGESMMVHVKGYPDILVTANSDSVEVGATQNNARLFVGPVRVAPRLAAPRRRTAPQRSRPRVAQIAAQRKSSAQKPQQQKPQQSQRVAA